MKTFSETFMPNKLINFDDSFNFLFIKLNENFTNRNYRGKNLVFSVTAAKYGLL